MIEYGWIEAALLIGLISGDLIFNWWWIERVGKEPNHMLLSLGRALLIVLIVHEPDFLITLVRVLNAGAVYWFCFDYGLNPLRDKPLDYIGIKRYSSLKEVIKEYDGTYSLLDQLQLHTLPTIVWFVFKGIVALFCLINMLYSYNPYGNFLS